MSIRIIQKRIIFSIFDRYSLFSLFPDIFPQNVLSCIQLLSHGGCKSLPDSVADSRDESRVECKKILLVRVSSSIRSFLFFDLLERILPFRLFVTQSLSLSLCIPVKAGSMSGPNSFQAFEFVEFGSHASTSRKRKEKPGRRLRGAEERNKKKNYFSFTTHIAAVNVERRPALLASVTFTIPRLYHCPLSYSRDA